jgi:glutamate synthase domain-containing protein 3
VKVINARGKYYKELNEEIKTAFKAGETDLNLKNVSGQRYIGDGISGSQKIIIEGTPGNDMAAFMDGLEIVVRGNAQDAMANTMNNGRIIVHGSAGDTVGYAMRGGEIFIKGNVGYRVGIHMKEYEQKKPIVIVGGKAGEFFGEYMAGGVMILLGLNMQDDDEIVGEYCGAGMHGGVIYVRGDIEPHKLGKEVKLVEPDEDDMKIIKNYVKRFSKYFDFNYDYIMNKPFRKLYPYNKRPYGNLYAY